MYNMHFSRCLALNLLRIFEGFDQTDKNAISANQKAGSDIVWSGILERDAPGKFSLTFPQETLTKFPLVKRETMSVFVLSVMKTFQLSTLFKIYLLHIFIHLNAINY